MKIAIIGAGIMGLSAGWALARRGHRVTLVEQGAIPNPLGSSADQHRLIRFPYGAELGYQRMVADAYVAWDMLWAALGQTLYRQTGTLLLGEGGWVDASADTLARDGHRLEALAPAALARRFPLLAPDRGFFLKSGGVLLAEPILAALARHLEAEGVELRAGSRVQAVDPEQGRLVLADGSVLAADLVIIAAGPWVGRLLPDLAARVTPSRQVLLYTAPPPDLAAAWAAMPMLLAIEPQEGFYAVPPVAGTGLKFGDHRFSLGGDPDRDRDADLAEIAPLQAQCARRLHRFDEYRLSRLETCFYTVERAERFIVEPVGAAGWVISPCSGHGFKFGPLIGLRLAQCLDEGAIGQDEGANGIDIGVWAAGG